MEIKPIESTLWKMSQSNPELLAAALIGAVFKRDSKRTAQIGKKFRSENSALKTRTVIWKIATRATTTGGLH